MTMTEISRRDMNLGLARCMAGIAALAATPLAFASDLHAAAEPAKAPSGTAPRLDKLIYLTKGKVGFTHDQFVRRWRMHGAVGMTQPLWKYAKYYVQAEIFQPAPFAGASTEYDGIGYLVIDPAAFQDPSLRDPASGSMMQKDEAETFERPTPEISLWVEPETIKPGAGGGTTAFLFFRDAERARKATATAAGQAALQRVILNRRRAQGNEMSTLPYQAIAELSAPSPEALAVAVKAMPNLITTADVAVVTQEAVLWDRMTPR